MMIDTDRDATRFSAWVGIDDEVGAHSDAVRFVVTGDGKRLWTSNAMKAGDVPEHVDIDLSGVKKLKLSVACDGDGNKSCHADWADAQISYNSREPIVVDIPITQGEILTPPPPHPARICGAKVVGVRPEHPLLFTIAATGDGPIHFRADDLPVGLKLDSTTGTLTGSLPEAGEHRIHLQAINDLGTSDAELLIVAGETIAMTPPMGWNSWNCWGINVDQDKIIRSARGMVKAGLTKHGWTYINIDDGWQGTRGGLLNAIQPDPKRFPNIAEMCSQLHTMGLKVGIYSTPWVTSYGERSGGSSENEVGSWDTSMRTGPKNQKQLPFAIGRYHFYKNDARQWAQWGIDYLKFDWAPNEAPETQEMEDALRTSGRDIVLSLSNNTTNSLFAIIPEISKMANCWRINGDINDSWSSIMSHGLGQDRWSPYSGPGHWNDPDMFEVGVNGGGRPKRLTPDEQYTHVSLWCLLSAPLLLGCDLEHLDAFTSSLLTNDEVIAVDQDPLGRQATTALTQGDMEVLDKHLSDGSRAVGIFNLGPDEQTFLLHLSDLHFTGRHLLRDLWRQKDLGDCNDSFPVTVESHGVVLLKITGD